MMVHDQFKNQDTKFFNQHKNEHMRLPEPSLPNGQKPDFGNGNSRSKRNSQQNKGQLDKKKSQYNNNNNNNAKENGTSSKSKNNRSKNHQRSQNQKNSPLGSPRINNSQINTNHNYSTSTPPPTASQYPSQSTASVPVKKPTSSISSFAGSTFTNSPETKSLPKPSFL